VNGIAFNCQAAASASQLHEMLPLNFYAGKEPPDNHIDLPPFGEPHLKLQLTLDLTNYVTTSIGIAIRKNA
jgi:hypothetical protein